MDYEKSFTVDGAFKFKYDCSYTKHDGGLGDITYDVKLSLDPRGVYDLPQVFDDIQAEDPDLKPERIKTLEISNGSRLFFIPNEQLSEEQFYNLEKITAHNTCDRVIHQLMAKAREIDMSDIQYTRDDDKTFGYSDSMNARDDAVVKIDGYTLPVKFLKKHEGTNLTRKIQIAKAMIDANVPFSRYNEDKVLQMAHAMERAYNRVGDADNVTRALENYPKFGFLNHDGADYSDKTAELTEAFKAKFKSAPKIIDSIAFAASQYGIPTEDIVSHFDYNRTRDYLRANIPQAVGCLLLTGLDNNDFYKAIRNQYYNEIAELVGDYLKTNDVRYKDIALFLTNHSKAKPDLVRDIMKNKDIIALSEKASTKMALSEISRATSFSEVARIEKKYDGFHFADCKFDLKFSDVTEGNLTAGIMKPGDTRMVTIGYDTHCCQHLGDAGETAMMYGLIHPNAGFWTIEDINTHKILAQAEIWEKDKVTLVFDNIEFADDRDVSQYAAIIGKWAEQSGYDNVYMGNGYNALQKDGLTQVEGLRPPVGSEYRKFGDKPPYSDAEDKCTVIMQDRKVEPYFKEQHAKRLLGRGETPARNGSSIITVESYKQQYSHIDELEYMDAFIEKYRESGAEYMDDFKHELINDETGYMSDSDIVEACFQSDEKPDDTVQDACKQVYGMLMAEEHQDDIILDGMLSCYEDIEGGLIPQSVYEELQYKVSSIYGDEDIEEFVSNELDRMRDDDGKLMSDDEALLDIKDLFKTDWTYWIMSHHYVSRFNYLIDEYKEIVQNDITSDSAMADFAEEHSYEIADVINVDLLSDMRDAVFNDLEYRLNEEMDLIAKGAAIDEFTRQTGLDGMPEEFEGVLSYINGWDDIRSLAEYLSDEIDSVMHSSLDKAVPCFDSDGSSLRDLEPGFGDNIDVTLYLVAKNGIELNVGVTYSYGAPISTFKDAAVKALHELDVEGYIKERAGEGISPSDFQTCIDIVRESISEEIQYIDPDGKIRDGLMIDSADIEPVTQEIGNDYAAGPDAHIEPMTYEIPKDILTAVFDDGIPVSDIYDGINGFIQDNFPENLYTVTIMPASIQLNVDAAEKEYHLSGQQVKEYEDRLRSDIPKFIDGMVEKHQDRETAKYVNKDTDIGR